MSPDAEYYAQNGEKTHRQRRNHCHEQKAVVLRHYGGECEACGEREPDVLTVDHIQGNGAEHRKEVPASQIHAWLIKNEFPRGFRVLCFNCNHRSRRSIERGNGPLQTIRNLQREVSEWADSVYPDRTLASVIGKMQEEYQELMDALNKNGRIDPLELADLMILALDGATLSRVDVQNAVREKVGINYTRSWLIDPKTGLMSHRRGGVLDGKEAAPRQAIIGTMVFSGGPNDGCSRPVCEGEETSTAISGGEPGGCYVLEERETNSPGFISYHYKWDSGMEVPL
ncbi:MAG: hypothetical protein DDT26_00011 [Dehalococcoidia bacterium]|nr:hypothetical protein [Chloroflexota bacterium]